MPTRTPLLPRSTLRPPVRGPRSAAVPAALALVVVAAVLLGGDPRARATLVVDDLSQLAAALCAAAGCAVAARRCGGRRRRAWTALALGCGGWAVGQAIWSWYELVLGHATPFPSVGDLGFLAFPVAATAALALHPSHPASGDRRRRVLDGVLVTASLALLSWVTALDAVLADEAAGLLADSVALAYPAGDVVVLTMVVVLLGHATRDRTALVLVGTGVGAIALSDSAFLYLTALGAYSSEQHGVSLGWCTGFVLIALGALSAGHGDDVQGLESLRPARTVSLLPYVPALLALGLATERALRGGPPDRVEGALTALVVLVVLLRQYVLVADHARLLGELADREAELRAQAFSDGLTGLANRALFRDRLAHALDRSRRDGRCVTVLFCDLDDFKLVNDTLGHATGDALLVVVAERLQSALRTGDTLARLGGDEFAVLLEDGEDPLAVAQAVLASLRPPVGLAGREVVVRASIGTTTVRAGTGPQPSVDALLAQADTAMYTAKRGGGGTVRSYQRGMALAEVTDAALTRALEGALARRELTLAYQPLVDLQTGRVDGLEVLARWSHEGRDVPPAVFVPLAERTGLIAPLTSLVLDLACRQVASWRASGLAPHLRVGVNLSPLSVTDLALPEQVAACLGAHGLPGAALVVEITESGVISDPQRAREVCGALRALGVMLSLDDFGVGFSSLAHLQALPLDSVKLDRSLLADLGRDARVTAFLRAVLRLGEDLGLKVVAEGVERPEQLAALHRLGCAFAQGYLLARPAPADAVPPLLGEPLLRLPELLQQSRPRA